MIEVIDAIQSKRAENNRNWMDLVRLAIEVAPDRAKEIMRRIHAKDAEISELAGKLAE